MKILKVDDRGRISLKKIIKKIAPYYKVDIKVNEQLILTPIIDKEEVKLLSKEEHE